MNDFIFEEFKNRVEDFGITIDNEDAEGNIEIDYGDSQIIINLTNARKSYALSGDLTHLDRIVHTLHTNLMGALIPSWEEASPKIYSMLTSAKVLTNDHDQFVKEDIADGIIKVFIIHDKGSYTWISNGLLKFWDLSPEDLRKRAEYNMDCLLDESRIQIMKLPGGVKFGAINSDISWLNSAALFSKDFKKKIESIIGWPIYFAMPTREFCYFVHVNNKSSLGILSSMFDDIFRHEELLLTREIFSMTENGIKAIGSF